MKILFCVFPGGIREQDPLKQGLKRTSGTPALQQSKEFVSKIH